MTSYVGFETGGYLDRLETDFNVVRRVRPYLSGEQTRNVRYYLDDNFLSFWFRFIYKYRSAVEIGNMDYVLDKIEADYETFSGFVLEKWFRQAYGEMGEYNLVTNYWKKGSKGAPGEDQEIDLVAVNEAEKILVLGECKRNPEKISMKFLQDKAEGILSHHRQWETSFVSLSLDNII